MEEGLFLNPNLDSIFMLPIFALAPEPARTRMRIQQRIVCGRRREGKPSRVELSRAESWGNVDYARNLCEAANSFASFRFVLHCGFMGSMGEHGVAPSLSFLFQ